MNDYLGNLIVRSLPQSVGVEPRLAARFESLQPNSLTTVILEEQENIVQAPLALSTSSQQTSVSDFSTVFVPRQVSTPNSVQVEGGVSPIESKPEPIETLNVEQRIPEPTAPSQDSPQTHSVSSKTVAISKLLVEVNTNSTTLSPQPIESSSFMSGEYTPQLLSPQIPLKPVSSSPLPIVQSEPPVIRVTIGRIDVRAVAPSTPTRQPSKPPTPRLSLTDYLKAQNGGRK